MNTMATNGLYEQPWRYQSNMFQTLAELKDEIENYVPIGDLLTTDVQFPHVNILLFGGVGEGKSSVFNTINSVFRGKIFNVALSGPDEYVLTKKFTRYPVMSGNRPSAKPLNFRICDMRGLEYEHLMTKENMRYLLEGNITDKFPFDPSGNITANMPGFLKHPSLHDMIHCVAIVLDAGSFHVDDSQLEVRQNIQSMRKVINGLDIPQVVTLTKIDRICEKIYQDPANAFRSPELERHVAMVSEMFGLSRNSIFPMKNYESECQLDPSIDTLALLALKGILNNCDAYLYNHYNEIVKDYSGANRRRS